MLIVDNRDPVTTINDVRVGDVFSFNDVIFWCIGDPHTKKYVNVETGFFGFVCEQPSSSRVFLLHATLTIKEKE